MKATIEVVKGIVEVNVNDRITKVTGTQRWTAKMAIQRFTSYNLQGVFDPESIKRINTEAGDQLGVSAAMFAKMLNGAIVRAYIAPNYKAISQFGYFNGKINHHFVKLIIEHSDIIAEYVEDGNEHLACFAILLGNAQQAKKTLGASLWKSLHKNSRSRNVLIVHNLLDLGSASYNLLSIGVGTRCATLQKLPSTLLKLPVTDLPPEYLLSAIKASGLPLYKIDFNAFYSYRNTWDDCRRMLGDKFNDKWSYSRVKKEHDTEAKRLNAMKYSTEPFPYVEKLPGTIKHGSFTATLVTNAREINNLGIEQRNCVGSYHRKCCQGTYAVYVITDKEDIISLVGLSKASSQHYHACDRIVEDAERIAFSKKIIEEVRPLLSKYSSK